MNQFQLSSKDDQQVYLEETDKPLPEKLNPNTRYIFLSTIATGGKSLINAYKDMHLSRVVVYKTLKSEFINDEIEQLRLLREARVSAMLQHPNTVPVYEIGRDRQGNYYFTMKRVHGYTLREIFDYRERYDLTQLIEVIEQVAQALAYAHAHGVAHRDIKPENILVGPYGEVLVLDWGLAKVWHRDGRTSGDENHQGSILLTKDQSITGRGALQGTLCYMSPEQIHKDPKISYSTDIYSLGSVLYELLTGKTPFTGDKTYEILDQVENKEPEKPSDITKFPPTPKLLEDLCLKCLKKDPQERPKNMDEVIRVLNQDWMDDLIPFKRKK